MVLQRSLVVGDTNYIGASLEDILDHLSDWHSNTQDTVQILLDCRRQVLENYEGLDFPDSILEFIDYTVNQLQRFLNDFARLRKELPNSVEPRHPELVLNLAEFSKILDDSCLDFKREHIQRGLTDETLRHLVDRIYSKSRTQVLDYRDLFNLADQLKTFVEIRPDPQQLAIDNIDALELKPNLFGLGINLNHLIKRLVKWWENRSSN